jgi:hypothetical protein
MRRGFQLLGYPAGNSYQNVARIDSPIVAAVAVAALLICRIRKHPSEAETPVE